MASPKCYEAPGAMGALTPRPAATILVVTVCAAVTLIGLTANAGDRWVKDAQFSARLRSELALGFSDPTLQKSEFACDVRLDAKLAGDFGFVAIVRALADPADELRPGHPEQSSTAPWTRILQLGDAFEGSLRELYVTRRFDNVHLTLGKQQVVWGKTDGLKLLDVVDPQDYREFILDDFADSRIPLWTANVEVITGPATIQLLWIPDRTYHSIPEPGAIYAFTSDLLVPPAPPLAEVVLKDANRPNRFFADSDAGVRVSAGVRNWDFTLNYFYHYGDSPILLRDTEIRDDVAYVITTPEYRRAHLIGGSFATAFGNLALRGEAGYWTDRYVSTTSLTDLDGVTHGSEWSHVLGLDWYGIRDTLVSVQLFQRYVDMDDDSAIQRGWTRIPTLLVRKGLPGSRWFVQGFWLTDIEVADGLVRLSASYDVTSTVRVGVGFDAFYGPSRGVFGEFDSNDRTVFEVEARL